MLTKKYTTHKNLEVFLGKTVEAGQADDAINASIDIVEKMTGVVFVAGDTVSARLFNGDGSRELIVDECTGITKVERGLDQYGDSFEEIANTGLSKYILQPDNYGSKGLPVTSILLRDRYWGKGTQNHRITAKWGYGATVPPAVQMATTIIAAGIYNYNSAGSGNVKSEKIGNYSVTYSDDEGWDEMERANKLLQGFKKFSL